MNMLFTLPLLGWTKEFFMRTRCRALLAHIERVAPAEEKSEFRRSDETIPGSECDKPAAFLESWHVA